MGKVLDTANTDDQTAFEQIRDLVGFTDTDSEIDGSPLFKAAENELLAVVPGAALPSGRTATNRAEHVDYVVFLASSYFLDAGASTSAASSTIKSVTILGVRREYVVSGGATAGQSKADFLKSLADDILERVTGTSDNMMEVLLTKGAFD